MSQPSLSPTSIAQPTEATEHPLTPDQAPEANPSYVKLAMRNMVRKRSKSLTHFTLTTVALLSILVGLAYLTH